MAGGTWKAQDKRRPGAYINVVGNGQRETTSSLGRVLLVRDKGLGWGKTGIVEVDANADFTKKLGTTLDDPALTALKETLKGASKVLVLNPNEGTAATLTKEGYLGLLQLTILAKKVIKLPLVLKLVQQIQILLLFRLSLALS